MVSKKSKIGLSDIWGNNWNDCMPLSEEEFREFERRISITIPQELKALFLSCNGGCPEKTYFTNGYIEVEFGSLLPVRASEFYKGEILEVVQAWLQRRGCSPELLAFAYDNGNAGVFCFDTKSGEINYWVQDELSGEIRKVASSLNEFFSGLTYPPY